MKQNSIFVIITSSLMFIFSIFIMGWCVSLSMDFSELSKELVLQQQRSDDLQNALGECSEAFVQCDDYASRCKLFIDALEKQMKASKKKTYTCNEPSCDVKDYLEWKKNNQDLDSEEIKI